MAFKLLLLSDPAIPESAIATTDWLARLRVEIPEAELFLATSTAQAEAVTGEVEAAFGVLPPDLFAKAGHLRWLASPRAGPDPSFYHPALVASAVEVTNVRGIYNDHISAQVMAYLLAFARGLPAYWERQRARRWKTGVPTLYLPEATLLVAQAASGRRPRASPPNSP